MKHLYIWILTAITTIAALVVIWGYSSTPAPTPIIPSPIADTVPIASVSAQPTPEASIVTILTTGDMMLGRSVNYLGWKKQDWGWSWRELAQTMPDFDLVIANLENPIIADCPLTNEGMIFCAHASAAAALVESPIDVITLANNHIANYGNDGITQTQTLLKQAGQDYVSAGELYITDLDHHSIGILAFDDTASPLDEASYSQAITQAASQVDILLVALHFGQEYRYQPLPRQQELAHLAIEAGAQVVVGNHSHWLGPVELYQDGAIIYSHGNLIFDQMWSEETKQGIAAAWQFSDGRLSAIHLYPIYITDYGLAHWEQGSQRGQQILDIMQRISQLGTFVDDHLVISVL